jgi:hypothetical protein
VIRVKGKFFAAFASKLAPIKITFSCGSELARENIIKATQITQTFTSFRDPP